MELRYEFSGIEELIAYISRTSQRHLVHQFNTLPGIKTLSGIPKDVSASVEGLSFRLLHSKEHCFELGINYRDPSSSDFAVANLTGYLALTNNLNFISLKSSLDR